MLELIILNSEKDLPFHKECKDEDHLKKELEDYLNQHEVNVGDILEGKVEMKFYNKELESGGRIYPFQIYLDPVLQYDD